MHGNSIYIRMYRQLDMHGNSQEEPLGNGSNFIPHVRRYAHIIASDHALLVPHDGVVDHAGDGAHGRPVGWVILEALHCDPP